MSVLSYAVRGSDGGVARGQTSSLENNVIFTGNARQISLNLAPVDVVSYIQNGNDLLIELATGEVINLQGYFHEAGGEKDLFLSKDGEFHEVDLGHPIGSQFPASYETADMSGKWSQYDELTFLDLERIEPVVAPLVAPALGGLGSGAAAVGGAALLVGGGGGGNSDPIIPTVTDPDVERIIGGSGSNTAEITGTGEAGSTVTVTIGDKTQVTTVEDDGTWTATFDANDLPADGVYTSSVQVVAPNGTVYDLAGPSVDIDTTAPDAPVTEGTLSVGETVNAEEHADGHVIAGTGEAGAIIEVSIGGTTHSTTVNAEGNWSVTFASSEIATGEYETEVTVTSTDARGNSVTQTDILSVDTEGSVTLGGPVEGDNIVNASEVSDGITLTGTADAGSQVVVSFQGIDRIVTADNSGNWSVDFAAGEIASGEYDAPVTVTATDVEGNISSTSGSVRVDTQTSANIDNDQIGGDDTANATEVASGFALTGTGEAGASVQVTLQGVTKTVTADAGGNWSANFSSAEIQQGEYDAAISVTSTDTAGNSTTVTDTIRIDTEVAVAVDREQAGGDNIANAAEVAGGLSFTGTASAGEQVQVTFQGVTKTVTAAADGTWTANYASSEISQGEYTATLSATVTDAAGNSASSSQEVRVDTSTQTTVSVQPAASDTYVNAGEMQDGVTLDGTGEPGSSIRVDIGGVIRETTVNASGTWSVTYENGSLPAGTYTTTANVTATDLAGNTATSSSQFHVDTDITNPLIDAVTFSDDDVTAVTLDVADQDYAIHGLNPNGSTAEINTTEVSLAGDESLFALNPAASDGTNLVISGQDDAGNRSDTLLVVDDDATNAGTVEHAAIGNFQIQGIELDYAADVHLTLTENQIKELSDTSDTLTIHGGSDDTVNVTGAQTTGDTVRIEGEDYDVYTIGDDGVSLVIDQDINVVI